jgi:hypothetical protein
VHGVRLFLALMEGFGINTAQRIRVVVANHDHEPSVFANCTLSNWTPRNCLGYKPVVMSLTLSVFYQLSPL